MFVEWYISTILHAKFLGTVSVLCFWHHMNDKTGKAEHDLDVHEMQRDGSFVQPEK